MSDGLSDYWSVRRAQLFRSRGEVEAEWLSNLSASDWDPSSRVDSADLCAPIVPRRDSRITAINPPPAYFWLGRDAEAA